MIWKRRRDRWRKLPTPSVHGLGFGVVRSTGTVSKVPKVPGGPDLRVSVSGEVEENRPWSLVKWTAILAVGAVVAVLVFPFLFTWLFWLVLGGIFAVLTYRTWR
jgi:hypothetical protein